MGFFNMIADLFRARHKSSRQWIRAQALEHINDQEVLKEMFRNEPPNGIQAQIIEKINDQDFLVSLVNENGPYSANAARRIKNQKYFSALIQHANPEVRLIAVKKTEKKEQALLKKIVLSDDNHDIRMLALDKIEDREFLMGLIETAPKKMLKKLHRRIEECDIQAIKKMTDQESLKRIFSINSSKPVRKAALQKITDQDFLLDIIKTEPEFAETVLHGIHDEEYLLGIALNETIDYSLRDRAYRRLESESSFAEIAAKGGTWNFCFDAARKVRSPHLLERILLEADPMVSSEIITRLPVDLDEKLMEHESESIRISVISRSKDQNLLAKAALEDSCGSIRQMAALKISDPDIRKRLAATSNDTVVSEIVRLPITGTCNSCGKNIRLVNASIRSVRGDYSTMHFFYCPQCSSGKSNDFFSGRLTDANNKDIVFNTPGGEWG